MSEHEWVEALRTARVALLEALRKVEAAEDAYERARRDQEEAMYRLRSLQDEFGEWLLAGEKVEGSA